MRDFFFGRITAFNRLSLHYLEALLAVAWHLSSQWIFAH
ncbi:unnamed protein product [Musa hybrid cultivar]